MIKVIVEEHHPAGLVALIEEIQIINTGRNKKSPEYGDYLCRFTKKKQRTVKGHKRGDGWNVLLRKVLEVSEG
jgi:hypothetical protein